MTDTQTKQKWDPSIRLNIFKGVDVNPARAKDESWNDYRLRRQQVKRKLRAFTTHRPEFRLPQENISSGEKKSRDGNNSRHDPATKLPRQQVITRLVSEDVQCYDGKNPDGTIRYRTATFLKPVTKVIWHRQ